MNMVILEKTLQSLNSRGIRIADNDAITMNEIVAIRKSSYEKLYPEVINHGPDWYDENGLIFFCRDRPNNVTSTARIALEGPCGLPSEDALRPLIPASHRQSRFAEIGKFVIENDPSGRTLRNYFAAFFMIGCELNLTFVFLASVDTVRFYERLVGATVLSASIGKTFGSNTQFAAYLWCPDESSVRFKALSRI